MTLKTPWTLIDPDGEGILARIVTDAEMGHVAVFDSASTARAVVETMNRAESREQELAEVTAECERLRGERDRLRELLDTDGRTCKEALDDRDRLQELISRLHEWTLEHGPELCPGLRADTFGEGMRAAKERVRTRIASFGGPTRQP